MAGGEKISQVIKQEFTLPFMGVVFLSGLGIISLGHFAKIDLGIIGFLGWIVVLSGVGYFILKIIAEFN